MLPNYTSALARSGHFIPGLMEKVAELRLQQNKQQKADKKNNVYMPHIRNALINVPSEDIPRQKKLQDDMRIALDDMHRQIVDDVAKFVNDKTADADWLASPVNIDYIASDLADRLTARNYNSVAYEKNQLVALIKLLTFFAITINNQEVPAKIAHKVEDWYDDAEPLFEEIKLAKRAYKLFDPTTYRLPSGKISTRQDETLKEAMKGGRKILRDTKAQRGFASSPEYRAIYRKLLSNLFTYFNSYSDNAYNSLITNVHALGDNDLNSILVPEFSGDSTAEAAKLTKLVKRHGGSGFALTPDEANELKEDDPEAWKAYNKQKNLVRNAVRTTVKQLVRAGGKKLMAASKIKQELTKRGLPTYYIPAGFENGGQYDEDMQGYTAKGVRMSITPVGGWLRWKSGTGADKQAIAEYQTPGMQKSAKIYSIEHVKVGRNVKKYEDTEENIKNIESHKATWTADTKSNDPRKQMLAYMAQVMYYTAIRVGSKLGKTGEETTYGLTKLTVGHVRKRGDDLILDFLGKSGMHQQLKIGGGIDNIRDRLIAYILKLTEGKPRKDFLWTLRPGGTPPSSSTVNKYLEEHGWQGTAKTFRTVRGSILMEKLMENEPQSFRNRQNAEQYMINLLTQVGKTLGHKTIRNGVAEDTWRTAATSYVNPNLIIDFFHRHHVNPMPSWAGRLEHVKE